MKAKLTILLAAVLAVTNVYAANTYTVGNTISEISAYSVEESVFPEWKSYTQVAVNGALSWSAGGCNSNYVVIRKSDTHLLDLVNLAYINQKTVVFGADTAVPKIGSSICLARMVQVK
ncbi:hypothetical protein C2869_04205 [Saccharobesus litoralis]|uniref:Uncharacterized protein n=1 Tax=Saccharobesus litoralis TaxID=2172099 RepID=A0A2S0VN84_9ALTE|nr:hypothetical protein [Saccharobesus litoralis]AWB65688.1 hypothetical protein C2869_04205 [Saccharobesus litoralis]